MEELYFKIFEALPRQGPGGEAATKKALQKLSSLPQSPAILDVGCGTGAQTLVLAKLSQGNITALDKHAPFIDILKHNARQARLVTRIRCVVGDMAAMDFPKEHFDVIWSEGAAYNIGFTQALTSWNAFLKQNGYLVVSELVWFKKDVPQEISGYFVREYPDMEYYEDVYAMIQSVGYELVDYFPLPSTAWWTEYYTPAEKKLTAMREEYQSNTDAQALFDAFQLEINMYRKYSEYYGYGFYIMQRG
jgi:SAM-dependent methyltransferase